MKLNEYDGGILRQRILEALKHACNGQVDGSHHKAWSIDQMVRALLGCEEVEVPRTLINGKEYMSLEQAPNATYNKFIAEFQCADPETGEVCFVWEEGIP